MDISRYVDAMIVHLWAEQIIWGVLDNAVDRLVSVVSPEIGNEETRKPSQTGAHNSSSQ